MKKDRELLQAILRECRRATIILNFGSLAVMFYLLGVDGPILVPAAAWSTGLLLGALAFVAGRRSAGGKDRCLVRSAGLLQRYCHYRPWLLQRAGSISVGQ